MVAPPSPRRRKTTRLADVARDAGVSIATVDRVFNEREAVSASAREKVIAAARALGVRRLLPETHRPLVHLDLILPKNDSPFFLRLRSAFRHGIAMLDQGIVVHRHIEAEEHTVRLVRRITDAPYPRVGMILAVPDRTEIRAAVAKILASGQHVVAVVTDLPGLAGLDYLGIDNRRAGATAAHLLGRSVAGRGRIAVLGAHHDWRGHSDRTDGFRTTIARDFPHLVCEIIDADTHDDPYRCARALRAALAAGPLAGIYNTGAGSAGIAHVLQGTTRRPCWIGHEISDDHIAYLRDRLMDFVIDQNPPGQAMGSLQTILYRCKLIPNVPGRPDSELCIYTRENLPRSGYFSDTAGGLR